MTYSNGSYRAYSRIMYIDMGVGCLNGTTKKGKREIFPLRWSALNGRGGNFMGWSAWRLEREHFQWDERLAKNGVGAGMGRE
jgi:hypothetical protein